MARPGLAGALVQSSSEPKPYADNIRESRPRPQSPRAGPGAAQTHTNSAGQRAGGAPEVTCVAKVNLKLGSRHDIGMVRPF